MSKKENNLNTTELTSQEVVASQVRDGAVLVPNTWFDDSFLSSKKSTIAKLFGKKVEDLDSIDIIVGGVILMKAPGKVKSYNLIPMRDETELAEAQALNCKMVNTLKMVSVEEWDDSMIRIKTGSRVATCEVGNFAWPSLYGLDKIANLSPRIYMNDAAKSANKVGFEFDLTSQIDKSVFYNEETDTYSNVFTNRELQMYFNSWCTNMAIEFGMVAVEKKEYLIDDFGGFMTPGDADNVYITGSDASQVKTEAVCALGLKSKIDLSDYYGKMEVADVSEMLDYFVGNVGNVNGKGGDEQPVEKPAPIEEENKK